MEFKTINKRSNDKRTIREIFLEAFPPEERPPFFVLLKNTKKSGVDFNGIYDGEKLIGLTYVIRENDIAYLFFFAIKKEERGRGYGGRVLDALKEKYKDFRLFLALEQLDENAENYAQRLSRHQFYKRYGFNEMPYQLKEASVIYDVMGIGDPITSDEYKTLINSYLGTFLARFVDMRLIPRQ